MIKKYHWSIPSPTMKAQSFNTKKCIQFFQTKLIGHTEIMNCSARHVENICHVTRGKGQ